MTEIAEQTEQEITAITERLGAAGIAMAEEDSVKQAADVNGLSAPLELLKAMLVAGYRPGGEE